MHDVYNFVYSDPDRPGDPYPGRGGALHRGELRGRHHRVQVRDQGGQSHVAGSPLSGQKKCRNFIVCR